MVNPRPRAGAHIYVRLTIAVMVAVLAGGAILQHLRPRMLVSAWRDQLDGVADEEAELLLRNVAETGDEGIPVLVAALGSRRPSIAIGAEKVLREQINRWESLGVRGSTPKMKILAASLARECGHFGPSAQQVAGELAAIVLRWPIDPALIDRGQMVADCEVVVRSASARRPSTEADRLAAVARGELPAGNVILAGRPSPGNRFLNESGSPLAGSHRMPGGGLPIESIRDATGVAIPTDPPEPDEISPVRPPAGRMPKIMTPDLAQPLRKFQEHRGAANGHHEPASPPGATQPMSGPQVNRQDARHLPSLREEELFPLLRSTDMATADAARVELVGRGFAQQQIALALNLTHPDPQQRQHWVQRLASLRGINAQPWLFWLTQDQDAGVRLSAITLLATSSDPGTLNRVREIAVDDEDARIRRVAGRIDDSRTSRRQ